MSDKNTHPNLPLETSWRDVLRVIHSKVKRDVQDTLVVAAERSTSALGDWLVKLGSKLQAPRQ